MKALGERSRVFRRCLQMNGWVWSGREWRGQIAVRRGAGIANDDGTLKKEAPGAS